MHRWSGQVLDTIDYCGFIGRNPGNERVYVATGDSGQGMMHGALAGLVEEQAGQEAWRLGIGTCCALHAVLGEHGLHGIPEWFVNDRGMLAGIGVALMRSFSAVGPVLKKKINELLPV
ncbi:hypothetical protein CAK95_00135 [Pseudorhodoplanes sinuspersici]|uniref:Uncharacterized protein n=1 Tax=Pseudorhodoplanes sinuspersici TaxID=1235591 RepID=A0A1W6ZJQ2_9HYPH|nr:FAD-binding oxidoreductase [Pseudorhodoplanes sinuspersici]ARP97658.1 hypothetical protein CAK95_00135 [Pseudorhodoplanes sinuspersici]